ncbi:hypothetical protein ASD40_21545 [Paenibacillus sp. Root444D2]|nr:hypothetical protein ASD40_21545 [Paenibacillus sp. Root444D2]
MGADAELTLGERKRPFPSLSVPIGSCKDTSLRVFFNESRCIKISFSMKRSANVASFVPLFGEND